MFWLFSQRSYTPSISGGFRANPGEGFEITVEQITYENIDPKVRNTIMVGLCIAMLAACFDGTIVGTIGTIVAQDLGGLELYAWMATAYMLCETIMIPVAGKLSDLYGRKPLFLIGLGLFTGGSVLAGMSMNMEFFIVCRAIQGLGGGILIPVAMAAVADLYSPSDRARMQGILGAIFGVGSGIGPLLGGYIEGAASWHWCFYINVPLAIAAFILTIKKFPTPIDDGVRHIDTKGIALLTVFLADILLFIEFGGTKFEWVSAISLAMIAVAVVLLLLFVKVEKRAIEPILAPHLIKNKTVIMAAVFMFIFGIGMVGAMMYTNMFVIAVMGLDTLEAGIWSLAMIAGMMITSMSSGSLVHKTGYKPWLVAGPILCFIGLYYLSGMAVDPDMIVTQAVRDTYMMRYLVGIFVLGLGLGCMMSVVMTAVQNSSKPSEIGMTTSSVNLLRSVGCTMGTAIFSLLINSKLAGELESQLSANPGIFDALREMNGGVINTGILNYIMAFPEHIGEIMTAFANSVDFSFIVGGVVILLLVIIGFVFKAQTPEVDEEFENAKKKVEEGR